MYLLESWELGVWTFRMVKHKHREMDSVVDDPRYLTEARVTPLPKAIHTRISTLRCKAVMENPTDSTNLKYET